jgi:hypothetical protein
MRTLKVIAGLVCLFEAFFLGILALWFREWGGGLWLVLLGGVFSLGFAAIGLFLIVRRRELRSMRTRVLMAVSMGTLLIPLVTLDLHIRHERRVLQMRAREFIARPLPTLLIPDSEGYVAGHYVDTNSGPQNGPLGESGDLIERYATKGRIRWSARIQGQFASTSHDVVVWGPKADAITDAFRTNEELRLYLAERNAILGKEWQMGFWQTVEDAMEMRMTTPEFEEEDAKTGGATSSSVQR